MSWYTICTTHPHGFRSTLRTWLTDNTDIPFEVAEMIIAHKTGSKVARAYNRIDYLEQRWPYMEMWADFLDQGYGNVCSLTRQFKML